MAKKKEPAEVIALPALNILPVKPTPITGNFDELEAVLVKWQKEILALDISEENMELVRLVKSTATQRRTLLTKAKTDNNRIFFNQPKDLYSKKMDHLIALVAKVEEAADKILDKEEQERIDKVQALLDLYHDEFQETYRLDERFLKMVVYQKGYFNKTADEKARKDDLEGQFKDLKKAQNAYHAGVRLITGMCAKDPRIDTNRFLNMLLGEDTAVVSEQVEQELARLKALDATAPATSSSASSTLPSETAAVDAELVPAAEPLILGEVVGLNFQSAFPGRNKTIQLEVVYPCDVGDALTELFSRLRKYGIRTRPIRQPEAVY